MINYRLKIDFLDSKTLASDICFVSGDVKSSTLYFEFYNDGKRVDISGYTLSIRAKRSDGVVIASAGKIENNTAIFTPENNFYAVPGELYMEIALSDSTGKYVTTKIITAEVLEGLGEAAIDGSDNLNVYVKLLNEAVKAKETALSAAQRADATLGDAVLEKDEAKAAAQRAQEAADEALENAGGMLFANALKVSASGEVVSITDISPVEHNLEVKVSSKNLIPYPYKDTTMTVNGITFTDNGDGSIKANGTATAQAVFYIAQNSKNLILPNTRYTLSGCNGGAYNTYRIRISDGKTTALESYTEKGMTLSYADTSSISILIIIPSGVTVDNVVFKPQLEKGTTATDYTPYVDVSEATLTACGKNLFNNDTSLVKQLTMGVKAGGTSTRYCGREIRLPAGTYTLTETDSPQGYYIYVRINDKDGNYVANAIKDKYHLDYNLKTDEYWIAGADTTSPLNFKIKDGDVLYLYDAVTGTGIEKTKGIFSQLKIQIEKGETATEYEPYKAPANYPVTADGTVEGVKSIYPNTTLLTETQGVLIDCEYNKDINKAFAELQNAIISLGGNV